MHLLRRTDAHFRVVTVVFQGATGDAIGRLPTTGRYRLTFKRGLKATNKGATAWAVVRNGQLTWDHSVVLNCTLFERKGEFSRKELKFRLESASSALISFRPKVRTVAKGRVDLADCFRRQRTQAQVLLPVESGEYLVVQLGLSFREWHEGDGLRDEQTDAGLTGSDCSDASDVDSETAAATSVASVAPTSVSSALRPRSPTRPASSPSAQHSSDLSLPSQLSAQHGSATQEGPGPPRTQPSQPRPGHLHTAAVRPSAPVFQHTAARLFPTVESGTSASRQRGPTSHDDLQSASSWSQVTESVSRTRSETSSAWTVAPPSLASRPTARPLPKPRAEPLTDFDQDPPRTPSSHHRAWQDCTPGSARSLASKLLEEGWTCTTCHYHNLSSTTRSCAICLASRAGASTVHPDTDANSDRSLQWVARGPVEKRAVTSRASSVSSAVSSSQSSRSIASFLSRGSHRSTCRHSCCACSGEYQGGDHVPPARKSRPRRQAEPQRPPIQMEDDRPHRRPSHITAAALHNSGEVWPQSTPGMAPGGGCDVKGLNSSLHRTSRRSSVDEEDDRQRRAQTAAEWVQECQRRYQATHATSNQHPTEDSLWAALQEARPPSSPELSEDSSSESTGTPHRRATTVVALESFEEEDDVPSCRQHQGSGPRERGRSGSLSSYPSIVRSKPTRVTASFHDAEAAPTYPHTFHDVAATKRCDLQRVERPVTDPSGYFDLRSSGTHTRR